MCRGCSMALVSPGMESPVNIHRESRQGPVSSHMVLVWASTVTTCGYRALTLHPPILGRLVVSGPSQSLVSLRSCLQCSARG